MQETRVWSLGQDPGDGNGNPLQYSRLENPMDRGAKRATVHGSQRVAHGWGTNTFRHCIRVLWETAVVSANFGASLVAQMVKNLPAMWETRVQSLGWDDPLEKGMATRSRILAWRIPMDRGAWRAYSPWGRKELDTTEQLSTFTFIRLLESDL